MESKGGTSRAAESKPHVFINHRGPDVKNTLVSHLYAALKGDGLRPFLDAKDIELGQVVENSIREALQGSCVHVAIFSVRYAESRHCLNELYDMLKSGKGILPVFYHVDPVDLRRIENGPFEKGFRKHMEQETEEQILKWKDALRKISGYRGLRLDEVNGNEGKLVRRILKEVRRLMPIVLPGAIERVEPPDTEAPEVDAIEGVEPPEAEAPEVGAIEGVEPPEAEAPEEPVVTFNPEYRRLNTLVLGDPASVEAVISHVCGADRHIQFQDHIENCGLTESRNSWPPIHLYGDTDGNDLTDVKAFVKARNERWHDWHRTKVEARNEVYRRSARELPDRTLRLHMVWVVCREISELPEGVKWSEITEKLYGLPVQILVIGTESTTQNVLDSQYDKVHVHGRHFFPDAQNLEELIVKVALTDGDLKENLWRKCWATKTRAEIESVAKLIRGIRRELGSAGVAVNLGAGGARIPKEVSLSRSGEYVLKFLCAYWDVPQDKMHGLLQSTTFGLARGNTINIRPCGFVKFCLIVAAIVLYGTSKNPEYIYNWDGALGASSELLQAEAEECYRSYFPGSLELPYYDQMRFGEIREFLQDIFERKVGICLRDTTPCPVVSDHSISSKIMKLICRGIMA